MSTVTFHLHINILLHGTILQYALGIGKRILLLHEDALKRFIIKMNRGLKHSHRLTGFGIEQQFGPGYLTNNRALHGGASDRALHRSGRLLAVLGFSPESRSVFLTAAPTISAAPSESPSLEPTISSHSTALPSSTPSMSPTELPTLSPSNMPSFEPTVSVQPSDIPSFMPSKAPSSPPTGDPTSAPSGLPTVSSRPSAFPSVAPSSVPSSSPTEAPDNNYCEDAFDVFVDDSVYISDLYYYPSSSPGSMTPTSSPTSSVFFSASPTATNENLPAQQLANNPTLVVPATDAPVIPFFFSASPTGAPSAATATLYQRRRSLMSERNVFASRQSNVTTRQYDFYVDDNGLVFHSIIDCKVGNLYQSPARWYRFTGIGPASVTTCNEGTMTAGNIQGRFDRNPKLHECRNRTMTNQMHVLTHKVFTDSQNCPLHSTCPRDLVKETTFDDEFNPECVTVTWLSSVGADYILLVSDGDGRESINAPIVISISTNDRCSRAYSILARGDTYTATISGTSADDNTPACGGATGTLGQTRWFRILGTGGVIRASTCVDTVIDTHISIIRGTSCDSLECVTGNDDGCNQQSSISWNSIDDVPYFIVVHTRQEGGFALKV